MTSLLAGPAPGPAISFQVDLFLTQSAIDKTVEESLRRVLAQKNVIENIRAKQSAVEDENQAIFDDQQRLRDNMKSLKGSVEEKLLIQRYTQQLNQQETKLDELRKQVADLNAQQQREQQKLDRMIQELSFDVNL